MTPLHRTLPVIAVCYIHYIPHLSDISICLAYHLTHPPTTSTCIINLTHLLALFTCHIYLAHLPGRNHGTILYYNKCTISHQINISARHHFTTNQHLQMLQRLYCIIALPLTPTFTPRHSDSVLPPIPEPPSSRPPAALHGK